MKKLSIPFSTYIKAFMLCVAIMGATVMLIGVDSEVFSIFMTGLVMTLAGATGFIAKLK